MGKTGLIVGIKDIDKGWKDIKKTFADLAKSGKTYVQAGFLGEKAQQQHVNSDLTIAQLGAVHEFGAPEVGIPERSFIRSTYDKRRETYWGLLRVLLRQVYEGKAGIDGALDLVGSNMAGDIRKAIRDGIPPPLQPATVARKEALGRKDPETPLLDTRQMVNAITHQVAVNGKVTTRE